MIEKPETRSRQIFKILWSIALFVFIIAGTFVIVSIGQGYRYDPTTGSVVQNGLLILDSKPNAANVIINDVPLNIQTSDSVSLPPGVHSVRLQKEGFREWAKSIKLASSEVMVVNYPLLFPEKLETKPVLAFSENSSIYMGPSNRQFMVADAGRVRVFSVTTPTAPPKSYEFADPKVTATDISWSRAGNVALITTSDQKRYLFRDDADEQLTDITTRMNGIQSFEWFEQSSREIVYLNSENKTLYSFDLLSSELPSVITENVVRYTTGRGGIAAIVNTPASVTATDSRLLLLDGRGETLAASLKDFKKISQLYVGSFENKNYIAYSIGDQVKVSIPNTEPKLDIEFTLPIGAEGFYASDNDRFLLAQKGNSFASIDIDERDISSFTLDSSTLSNIRAVGHGRFLAVADGKLVSFEFDGANKVTIGDASNFPVCIDTDESKILSFLLPKNSTTYNLQSTSLLLPSATQ